MLALTKHLALLSTLLNSCGFGNNLKHFNFVFDYSCNFKIQKDWFLATNAH